MNSTIYIFFELKDPFYSRYQQFCLYEFYVLHEESIILK